VSSSTPSSEPPQPIESASGSFPPARVVITEPDRPVAAIVLALLSGLFLASEGVVEMAVAIGAATVGLPQVYGDLAVDGLVSIVLGVLIVIFAVIIHGDKKPRRLLGTAILVMSTISLLLGGGFLIGFALGLVAGVWFIAWRPNPPFYLAPEGWTMCSNCGAAIPVSVDTCDNCGEAVPSSVETDGNGE